MRAIISAIMRSEGYSEEDIAYQNLSLKEKQDLLPNPLMPADKAFIIKTGSDEKTLTLDTATALCTEAIDIGIISQPLPFPPVVKDLPADAYWHDVNQNFISPLMNRMSGTYTLYLSGETIYAKNNRTEDTHIVSNFLTLEETPALLEHVMAGNLAMMVIRHLTPSWMTEPNYRLLREHEEATKKRDDCLSNWAYLYRQVHDAKDPVVIARKKANTEAIKALAIESEKQQQGIKNLPFKWKAQIKEVLSGLSENSNGDGWKKNTVIHVQLLEDFKRGRLTRNKGDYLCSPKKVPNWGDGGNYTEVTCKSCLKRAAALSSKTHQPIP